MKFFIVLVALFAAATYAAPAPGDGEAQIVYSESNVEPNKFDYKYETSNGIEEKASGVLNDEGSDHESLAVRGSFSFKSDDGQTYVVNYVADENGFQPQGSHLPVGPV